MECAIIKNLIDDAVWVQDPAARKVPPHSTFATGVKKFPVKVT